MYPLVRAQFVYVLLHNNNNNPIVITTKFHFYHFSNHRIARSLCTYVTKRWYIMYLICRIIESNVHRHRTAIQLLTMVNYNIIIPSIARFLCYWASVYVTNILNWWCYMTSNSRKLTDKSYVRRTRRCIRSENFVFFFMSFTVFIICLFLLLQCNAGFCFFLIKTELSIEAHCATQPFTERRNE